MKNKASITLVEMIVIDKWMTGYIDGTDRSMDCLIYARKCKKEKIKCIDWSKGNEK